MGSNPYEVTFILVVNDLKAHTYINDVYYSVIDLQEFWLTEAGPLSFMVMSGSDVDFGTRCNFTDPEDWIIEYIGF